MESSPIFIGGDARSGTTLLSVILNAHSQLNVQTELYFNHKNLDNLGNQVLEALKIKDEGNYNVKTSEPKVVAGVQFAARCDRCGIDRETLINAINHFCLSGNNLETFGQRCEFVEYLGNLNCSKTGKRRWGFKIMRSITNIEDYYEQWPNAKFINIIRDGRDVLASQLQYSWGWDDIAKGAKGWVSVIEKARKSASSCQANYYEIKYEDVVNNFEKTIANLLSFLEEEWENTMNNYRQSSHSLLESKVRHPSKEQVSQELYTNSIGRYKKEFNPHQIVAFEEFAGKMLLELGYDPLLKLINFQHNSLNCTGLVSCDRYVSRANENLVGRWIADQNVQGDEEIVACLNLKDYTTYEEYINHVKKKYKGSTIRQATKSDKKGYVCKPFARKMFIPDLVEINHSKEFRCGKPMKDSYLKTVEEFGGYPTKEYFYTAPECTQHYDIWWGIFKSIPGHQQGDIITHEKLLAYIDLRRIGNFALYSYILGHGDYLKDGIVYRLHFAVIEWLLDSKNLYSQNLNYLMYAGFYQGGHGLEMWKKKTLFCPATFLKP
ncbi:sulfotransferase [Arthrospira platensis NIES-46]|jgi:hypothetical protein|uniref:Sulfotransferase n=1 Tax=Limnospira platensis NIES-46 TaxID=1236695 RepID=A0A5M3TAF5_LIMPL|nr:sulfotransferase [Arthrospira platensis]GCE96464.1 sulfotransferase [Arthrospira platensis NIES-46]